MNIGFILLTFLDVNNIIVRCEAIHRRESKILLDLKETIMSKSKQKLDALKALFKGQEQEGQRESRPSNYYPFWNMQPGQRAIVRFLPDRDENNVRGFLVEKVFHNLTINGQKRTVPCLSMYEDDCPICKVSQDYYKAKDEVNGKKYWRKKQYIAQALIIEDPLPADDTTGETHVGKVRGITLGYQLYNIIKEAFAGDELESVPYDFEDGYDFIIKKTEQGQYASYAVGSKFKNNPRALDEDELVAVEEGMIELSTLLPKNPGEDKVQAMLNADLNGESYDEGGSSGDDDEDRPARRPAAKPAAKPVKAAAKPAAADDDEDEEEDEAPARAPASRKATPVAEESDDAASTDIDAMLSAIRARRSAK